jgi:hypothetical protein
MAAGESPFGRRRRVISIARQWHSIKRMAAAAERRSLSPSRLVCAFELQPTALSQCYTLKLSYALRKKPVLFVTNPELECRAGLSAPHLYADGSLCLYRPRYGEWNAAMDFADTILPWASLWLYFYEIWLATGVWHGEGEHPS